MSPWASPLEPVKKKVGNTRLVTDLRGLKKQTVKESYPLTNIQEILHRLKGATVFSSLYACGAYHAVRIKPGSRVCTAFISPLRVFQYIQILFGLANSGSAAGCWTLPSRRWTGTSGHHTCKTKLFQSEVEYLGHKISKGGVLMIPKYVQKIKDWPVPKSGKEGTWSTR